VFLTRSVRREVRMREMAMPRIATWCLCIEALVRRLTRTRMPSGMKRARTKSRPAKVESGSVSWVRHAGIWKPLFPGMLTQRYSFHLSMGIGYSKVVDSEHSMERLNEELELCHTISR
jgi:hypothetical protein